MSLDLNNIEIDHSKIKKVAEEAAEKAILNVVDEYYNSYNSPYKKHIKQQLESSNIITNIKLPDVVGLINDKLSQEFDMIANSAVANTFVPLLKKLCVRADDKVRLSEILVMYVEKYQYKDVDFEEYEVSVVEEDGSIFMQINFGFPEYLYTMYLHDKNYYDKDLKPCWNVYRITEISNEKIERYDTFTVQVKDDDKLKFNLPYRRDLLLDSIISLTATCMISNTEIILDVDEFDEEWFEEECHC